MRPGDYCIPFSGFVNEVDVWVRRQVFPPRPLQKAPKQRQTNEYTVFRWVLLVALVVTGALAAGAIGGLVPISPNNQYLS